MPPWDAVRQDAHARSYYEQMQISAAHETYTKNYFRRILASYIFTEKEWDVAPGYPLTSGIEDGRKVDICVGLLSPLGMRVMFAETKKLDSTPADLARAELQARDYAHAFLEDPTTSQISMYVMVAFGSRARIFYYTKDMHGRENEGYAAMEPCTEQRRGVSDRLGLMDKYIDVHGENGSIIRDQLLLIKNELSQA